MCFFGSSRREPAVQKYKSKNDPVVVTGEQENIEETSKKVPEVADSLKIVSAKQNPTLTTAKKLSQTKKKTII
mgnify:FL=1|tara:strand:- start:378 stop:596 length:219 start_codon:yes stop_codon:yes gene_type:complete